MSLINWLKDHAYLATWLALPVTIVAAVVQNWHKQFEEVEWSRLLIYVTFLTALAIAFTPTFDQASRELARYLVSFLIVFLIIDRKQK